MVDPITIAVGAQALGTIAQVWQSEKARGAAEDRLRELERIFDDLKPPEYDLTIMDPPEFIKTSIPEPAFDYTRFTPEAYEIVGQYSPELAPFIEMKAPQLAELGEAGKEGVEAQRAALEQLIKVSEGEDPTLQSKMNQAARRAQSEAGSREKSILQGAARRGALTSGLTTAAQLQSGASAMDRLAGSTSDAASDSYRQALNALSASGQLGGQIAGQEFQRESANADVLNRFNEMTTARYQNYLQNRANEMNQAQMRNLGEQQRVSDQNVQGRNQANMYNRERSDRLLADQYNRKLAERDYQNQMLGREAQFRQDERTRQANLQSQAFRDQLAKAQGKAGFADQSMKYGLEFARDRNAMFQGAADMASQYANYQQAQKNANREYELRQRELDILEGKKNASNN